MVVGRHLSPCLPYLQVEMEQALLQAEKRAEQEQVEAENEIMAQLQLKLSQLDKTTQKEKDKVGRCKTNQQDVCLRPMHVKKKKIVSHL